MDTVILGDDIGFKFQVSDLDALYCVHLRKITDAEILHSCAYYYPDENLCISNVLSYSIKGSYTGTDAGGLFWSLRPTVGNEIGHLPRVAAESGKTKLRVDVECRQQFVASAEYEQIFTDDSIEAIPMDNGLRGTHFINKNNSLINIMLLHGSGGPDEEASKIAATLALHGYSTLLLEYGECTCIEEVPLEYFKQALDYIAENNTGKILILGYSKGGEAALMLASKYPSSIDGICAVSPITAPYQSIVKDRPPEMNPSSTWTFENIPVPFVRMTTDFPLAFNPNEKVDIFPFYAAVFKNRAETIEKIIDVASFKGKILLLSGRNDRLCPSTILCDLFREKNKDKNIRHIAWDDAGHVLGWPGYQEIFPFSFGPFLLGGSDGGNGRATREAWIEILSFIEGHI